STFIVSNGGLTFSSGGSTAGYFSDGTRDVYIVPDWAAGHFVESSVTVTLASGGVGGYFCDGTRNVSIFEGTNNINYGASAAGKRAGSTPPTDVWIALDRLAAACNTMGTPP